jgi:predicted nucleic acid-binding protein
MLAVAVIDTSVFVADALSRRQNGSPSRVIDLALRDEFHLVLCVEILGELVAVLRRQTWPEARVMAYFGPVFDRASWLTPVPEEPHHLAAVQGTPPTPSSSERRRLSTPPTDPISSQSRPST